MGIEVFTGKDVLGRIHREHDNYKLQAACDVCIDLEKVQWETYPEIYKKDAFYCHSCFGISRSICSWE